jgi:hypothetical protein
MIDSSHRKIAAGKRRLLLTLGLVCLGGAASVANAAETLRFRVFLDQDPIGEHSFQVLPDAGGKRVLSRASFDVKLLVFNAYRYRHESREEWRDGCLERIEATTDDNGKDYRVEGTRERSALAVRINGDAKRLPQCVSTFAYWNRDFLKQGRLLNPQTGELVSVRVEPAGRERRVAQGREMEADRYRLRADGMAIDLWYTPDGRWIALESDTGKGRTLRYERI